MDIVELKNEHTAVQLNLSGGGIIWSIAHHRKEPVLDIQFIDSKLQDDDSFGLSVQAACWDGKILDKQYNPTQGGDILEHGSGLMEDPVIGDSTCYTKTRALHFHPKTSYVNPAGELEPNLDGNPVPSDITVEQWVTLKEDGVVEVQYKLTNTSEQTHAKTIQQVPVFHFLKRFDAYYTQLRPILNDFKTELIPYHEKPEYMEPIRTPEKWINIHDHMLKDKFGLTIYSDTSTEFRISNKVSVVMCQPYLSFGFSEGSYKEHKVILIPGTPLYGRKWLVDNELVEEFK